MLKKTYSTILIILGLLGIYYLYNINLNSNANKYYTQSISEYDKGNLENSLKLINEAIKINSQNSSYYNNKGILLMNLGEYNDAVINFDHAIKVNKNDSLAYNNKIHLLMNQGKYEDAINTSNLLLSTDPNNIEMLFVLSNLYYIQKEYKNSNNVLNKILVINNDNTTALINKGYNLLQLEDYDKAITIYETLDTLLPSQGVGLFYKGIAYKLQGNDMLAESYYKKSLEINPSYKSYDYVKNGVNLNEGITIQYIEN